MKKTTLLAFLLISFIAKAQTGEIFGIVTDEKNSPLTGASVVLENTSKGAQTDFDGKYRIKDITPGSYNLIVSFLGFETQTKFNVLIKSVGNQAYNFVLKESAESLNQIVISNKNRISRPKETPLSTQTLSAVEI